MLFLPPMYSPVPNKRADHNKQAGWEYFQNLQVSRQEQMSREEGFLVRAGWKVNIIG